MTYLSNTKKAALFGGACTIALVVGALPSTAMAQSGEAADDNMSDVITVTARKREETLLEIPVAVTAFDQDALDARGINSLDELSAQTAGFQFMPGANGGVGRGNDAIRIRGISPRASQPSNRPGAVFWDGGFVSHGAGIMPLIDLERVEIIKGPQTAFFGRNTFSGAVNFIPKEPGEEFSGKLSTSYSWSDDDSYNISGAVGGPLSDTFGIRVAGMYEKVGADWEARNGDLFGDEENIAGSIVATWEPSDNLKFKYSGIGVVAEDTHVQVSQLGTVQPGDCNVTYNGQLAQIGDRSITRPYSTDLSTQDLVMFCGYIPDFDETAPILPAYGRIDVTSTLHPTSSDYSVIATLPAELSGFDLIPELNESLGSAYRFWRNNLSAEYTTPDNHTITAQFAVGESASRSLTDGRHGSTEFPRLSTLIRAVHETYGEVRLTSPDDQRLRYMLGMSYYHQDNREGFVVGTWRINNQSAENIGIFGALDYDITDRLTASFEGRWHDDTLTVDFNGVSGTTPATSAATIVDEEQSYDAFMPRAILSYEWADNANIYASWSNSRLQGVASQSAQFLNEIGIDLGLGTFTPPQENTTYEIGAKQQIGNWLNYAIALYYTEWENQIFAQSAFSLAGDFFSANIAGSTEIKGIDFEMTATPAPWLDINGSFSYNDVEFIDSAGSGSISGILSSGASPARISSGPDAELISVAGNRPRSVPEWTATISAAASIDELFNLERDAWLRVDAPYHGQFFINDMNFNEVEGYWKLNLRAGVEVTDNASLEFYVDNLTNDLSHVANVGTTSLEGASAPGVRRTFAILPTKREAGIKLNFDF